MSNTGYENVVWGEIPIQGFLTAEELMENQLEFRESREFLFNKDYLDIGIAAAEGSLNGCPTQIIVAHFGGWKPPDYSQQLIDSWYLTLEQLRETRPSWIALKAYPELYGVYNREIDRISEIVDTRIARISAIIARMSGGEWLTDEEHDWSLQDQVLYREQAALAEKVNSGIPK